MVDIREIDNRQPHSKERQKQHALIAGKLSTTLLLSGTVKSQQPLIPEKNQRVLTPDLQIVKCKISPDGKSAELLIKTFENSSTIQLDSNRLDSKNEYAPVSVSDGCLATVKDAGTQVSKFIIEADKLQDKDVISFRNPDQELHLLIGKKDGKISTIHQVTVDSNYSINEDNIKFTMQKDIKELTESNKSIKKANHSIPIFTNVFDGRGKLTDKFNQETAINKDTTIHEITEITIDKKDLDNIRVLDVHMFSGFESPNHYPTTFWEELYSIEKNDSKISIKPISKKEYSEIIEKCREQ